MTGPAAEETPVPGLFAAVVGQPSAVAQLRSAARRPVHAYLLVGPAGAGSRHLARAFGAALLCPRGGCGACEVCRRALAGVHPDLVEIERSGAALSVDDARRVVQLAQRRPLEGARQVILVADVHLGRLAAPVLLKTLEEPPGPTVFVLLAETVPTDLATIASRCVRIELVAVPDAVLAGWLESQGVEPSRSLELAAAARGSVERARLLVDDPGVAARLELWRSVPTRLDGSGASAAALAGELLASAEEAVSPLQARNEAELASLASEAESMGERGMSGRKEIEDRHRREERRWRADEIRFGLAVLASAYRDRLMESAGPGGPARTAERMGRLSTAVTAVEEVAVELIRNPNESLMLEALLVRLSAVTG